MAGHTNKVFLSKIIELSLRSQWFFDLLGPLLCYAVELRFSEVITVAFYNLILQSIYC